MAYIKNTWIDQQVERPRTYQFNSNPDGSTTLIDDFGKVIEIGTPVNAEHMNHIEKGIAGTAIRLHNMTEVFAKDEWVKSGDKLYKSKQDQNKGHALQEEAWWKEMELGGGGLKVGAILTGIIDETENKERYLNGSLIVQDQFQSFTKWIKKVVKLYPSLNTTEENWQTELRLSAKGQCGKFVIDDISQTIRLPKVVNIQGLFDLSQAGVTKEAGLPNITGTLVGGGGSDSSFTGAFKWSQNTGGVAGGQFPASGIADFYASRSSSIYGKSNTVQEEAIQYPYYIVVATGSKDSIDVIREAELNNPFTFGMYQYSDCILNNISWLRSNGQWNTKAVFPDYYDWLLKIQNGSEPVEGISVKLSTQSYTDYDYVINTSVETFRLPLKVKQGTDIGLYLYFYVGETVQNANLINAGRIEEKLVNKEDKIVTRFYNNAWSRKYADGWLEQGGYIANRTGMIETINFPLPFAGTGYYSNVAPVQADPGVIYRQSMIASYSTTSMQWVVTEGAGRALTQFYWYASGQGV